MVSKTANLKKKWQRFKLKLSMLVLHKRKISFCSDDLNQFYFLVKILLKEISIKNYQNFYKSVRKLLFFEISINPCSSDFNELHEITTEKLKNRPIFFMTLILKILNSAY